MKVNLDATRILHFLTLIGITVGGGQILIRTWEWNPLTAYGLVCTIVCQISNVVMKILVDGDGDLSKLLKDKSSSINDNKNEKGGQNRSNKKKRK